MYAGIGCVSLFYVIDTGSIGSRIPPPRDRLGVTYLPFAFNSDAGYADLPLSLLGAPVSIWDLVKTWVTVSWQGQDRDWHACSEVSTVMSIGLPPGTGLHVPFRLHRGSAAIHPSQSRD